MKSNALGATSGIPAAPLTKARQTWPIGHANAGHLRWATGVLCAVLASVAIFTLLQFKQADQALQKRRLLEAAMQDLIVQSVPLRHLEATHIAQTRLALEQRGYTSTQDLLNQLSARLAVIETVAPQTTPIHAQAKALRKQLQALDEAVLPPSQLPPQHLDTWFSTLAQLNTHLKALSLEQDQAMATLQRSTIVLALAVLGCCVTYVAQSLWRHSRFRKRLLGELHRITQQARTDPLTGLLNRRGWQHATSQHLLATTRQAGSKTSIAILDIDYFKQYNDTYGHGAGDTRLQVFADLLKMNFRPGDCIARIGDEEFAVLLHHCNVADAKRIVDRMRAQAPSEVGFSAGLAEYDPKLSISQIMAMADQALYQAKKKGRNQSVVANKN